MNKQLIKRPEGRPTKYIPDKEFKISDIELSSFPTEKQLNTYLLKNIGFFMKSIFKEDVTNATDKKFDKWMGATKLKTGQVLPVRGIRLDLWVECKSGNNYIIEIKNPRKANYETFRAMGQILGYSIKFPKATNLVIVSTSYDDRFIDVINKYKLPIDFVLINKNQIFLLKK